MSENEKISSNVNENVDYFKYEFGDTIDLIVDENKVLDRTVVFVALDGMYNNLLVSQAVVKPILECNFYCNNGDEFLDKIISDLPCECDSKAVNLKSEALEGVLDGCMVVFVEGSQRGVIFSVQGFPKASVSEAVTEVQELGSKEAFVDSFKDNIALLRRRIKSPYVCFEKTVVGKASQTKVVICYHSQRVDKRIVENVKERIKNAEIDIVPGSGALRPFLDIKGVSFFSAVGVTERPDVLSSKIAEGRVGVMVDGSPYVLIVPYLFIEHFHSLDDYLNRPYYTTVMRIIKLVCFIISVLLPSVYVAVGTYHQELFPADVLYQIVAAASKTPFPLVAEVFVIHIIYEIVREAGLRMPVSVGQAVSIVGALVIGDAAVTAGLIAAPTLIIVALTAISSSVIPRLYQPMAILRLIFIILGGITGLYGVMIGFGAVLVDICAINAYAVPYSSPFSPFDSKAQGDDFVFAGWKKTGKRTMIINKLRGSGTLNEKRK